jgi:hypothetical protein
MINLFSPYPLMLSVSEVTDINCVIATCFFDQDTSITKVMTVLMNKPEYRSRLLKSVRDANAKSPSIFSQIDYRQMAQDSHPNWQPEANRIYQDFQIVKANQNLWKLDIEKKYGKYIRIALVRRYTSK